MKNFRIHLESNKNKETFRIKLLERPLRAGSKIFVEGFNVKNSIFAQPSTDVVICIRSSILGQNDYDSRTEGSSRLLGKVVQSYDSTPFVYYSDPCLCDMNSGRDIMDLNCLHGNIDIQLTRDDTAYTAIPLLDNGNNWALDLLIIESDFE